MGQILHSSITSASNIIDHISVELRKTSAKEMIKSNNRIGLIIDQSTMIRKLSALIV